MPLNWINDLLCSIHHEWNPRHLGMFSLRDMVQLDCLSGGSGSGHCIAPQSPMFNS